MSDRDINKPPQHQEKQPGLEKEMIPRPEPDRKSHRGSSKLRGGIRVNAVAPGPIWTPLIPASFPEEHVDKFGEDVPMGRPGQPEEVSASYVFLASDDSSYFTGQVLHPNGGTVING